MSVRGAFIEATAYALPARAITNADLEREHAGWGMDRVAERTGVYTRYWCAPDETSLDLGEAACRKLLDEGASFEGVGAIVFCTQTPDYVMPPNSCLLQQRLGLATTIAAFDFNLACSGFVYGLHMAKALIVSGAMDRVLFVAAETYSRVMHPEDRGPVTLFGDGGAATLITEGRAGLGAFSLATDGAGGEHFMVPAGGARHPRDENTAPLRRDAFGNCRSAENIHMNGAAVMTAVKKHVPPLVARLLQDTGRTIDDYSLVILHQASRLAMDAVYDALHVPAEKQYSNLERVGNTVSASIPMALRDAAADGALTRGDHVLLIGFGVGMSYAACEVVW
jgi:3-oxoacyl-[acyl-carrier-protein] synthase III